MYGGGLEWKLTHLCFLLSLVDESVWRVHSYETSSDRVSSITI